MNEAPIEVKNSHFLDANFEIEYIGAMPDQPNSIAVSSKISPCGSYIHFKAEGVVKQIEEFRDLQLRYLAGMQENLMERAVVDHIDLEFPNSMIQMIQLVSHYTDDMPLAIRRWKIGVVVGKENFQIAKFWEEVCHKRGFDNYRVFSSYIEAESHAMGPE
ncbi:MAG: hypothetical protein HKN32_06645 [Flavobacteriales bacterium]|nr:hypothetical protein [Flavobacteriales bacterium]